MIFHKKSPYPGLKSRAARREGIFHIQHHDYQLFKQ